MQDDLESLIIKKDGGAWLQVAYPMNAGMLTGSNELDTTPLRPPEIMFYAPTSLRPRYTRGKLVLVRFGPYKRHSDSRQCCAR